ncbi:DUF2190 domain-containing protein [Rhodoferax sp. U2-2l]|uniref:DUF2190 domain-containing protein n=1 Tax=Rhodoferax sp. U2-2l TaxID=2884000 RepID=UPI001D0B44D2|nr:DUF2190 domain-containing protein [Rhodoferax sp. U2-2l]MCB8748323.1 DUF2190 domain-containing protein [Rhodoferax sp. U2-2l]
MASQNNSGLQYQKRNAITMVLMAIAAANRILAYDGTYATSAGGVKDAQGVSETGGEVGDAISVVTDYSYPVEASAAITFGDYIKPATDGSGRAAVGTLTDHCGRALGAAAGAGQLFEMQIVKHVHA